MRLLSAVFLCFEIPILFSLPDAVDFGRVVGTAAVDLRSWFVDVFIIEALRSPYARMRLLAGAGAVLAFCCFDGLIQYFFGRNLFGFPYNGHTIVRDVLLKA